MTEAPFTLVGSELRSAGTILLVVIGVLVVSAVCAWFWGRSTLVPVILVEEMKEKEQYEARYCTPEHLQEACEMTKPYYGHEYVEGNIAEQWRTKNPKGFVEIVRECPTGSRKSAATVNTSYPTFCISAMLSSSRSRCAFSIQRCS